jgi:hypothetical protein
MAFTIRKPRTVLATVNTYGEALAWANANTDLKNCAITWGDKGSKMNLTEWRLIANNNIARLTAKGISIAALLANDGSR